MTVKLITIFLYLKRRYFDGQPILQNNVNSFSTMLAQPWAMFSFHISQRDLTWIECWSTLAHPIIEPKLDRCLVFSGMS